MRKKVSVLSDLFVALWAGLSASVLRRGIPIWVALCAVGNAAISPLRLRETREDFGRDDSSGDVGESRVNHISNLKCGNSRSERFLRHPTFLPRNTTSDLANEQTYL